MDIDEKQKILNDKIKIKKEINKEIVDPIYNLNTTLQYLKGFHFEKAEGNILTLKNENDTIDLPVTEDINDVINSSQKGQELTSVTTDYKNLKVIEVIEKKNDIGTIILDYGDAVTDHAIVFDIDKDVIKTLYTYFRGGRKRQTKKEKNKKKTRKNRKNKSKNTKRKFVKK